MNLVFYLNITSTSVIRNQTHTDNEYAPNCITSVFTKKQTTIVQQQTNLREKNYSKALN